ncbi:ornithine cyclodeaminase family protein [Afifella sp. IM 167]|uniref:ornithine cyclodeaminase family protein n=1 Tax=Afifella sp. IM 167 TaxID=2033586 RepID=UPI001CCC13ED|nr:ornithine cyclodeaminase family protein [Afifella sp. IM 167]
MAASHFLYLGSDDLRALDLSACDIADAIAAAFALRSQGAVELPPKSIIRRADGADFFAMPAAASGLAGGLKWLAHGSENAARGLPAYLGLMILCDDESGEPRAVLSAAELTTRRTAATSLLAARHLAKPDAGTLGLVGCGAQARAHLEAFAEAFPLQRLVLFGRGEKNIAALARTAAAMGIEAEVATTADEVLAASDLLVSSVPAVAPFIDAAKLSPGSTAFLVDHGAAWLDGGLAAFDRMFTDDGPSTALRAEAEPHLARMVFAGDFAGLATGEFGRANGDERLGFCFPGTALADLAAADLAVRRARERGLGTRLCL